MLFQCWVGLPSPLPHSHQILFLMVTGLHVGDAEQNPTRLKPLDPSLVVLGTHVIVSEQSSIAIRWCPVMGLSHTRLE